MGNNVIFVPPKLLQQAVTLCHKPGPVDQCKLAGWLATSATSRYATQHRQLCRLKVLML